MIPEYLVLAGRIRQELEGLDLVVDRAKRARNRAALETADADLYIDAAALNLHDFYSGLERIFRQIAATVDDSVPGTPEWHRDLLRQMCIELPGLRPAVLQPETCEKLDEFMRFRHVVRNVYAFRLDAERIGRLVKEAQALLTQVTTQLMAFSAFLEQVGQD